MGRINIRQLEQVDDESISFQKIRKKKTNESLDNNQVDQKPSKRKK